MHKELAGKAITLLTENEFTRPVGWPHASAIGRQGGITKWCTIVSGRVEWTEAPATIRVSLIPGEWEILSLEEFIAASDQTRMRA